jgi:hypothetical protein
MHNAQVQSAKGRVASLTHRLGAGHPRVAAARDDLALAKIAAYVQQITAARPSIVDRVADLLDGGRYRTP